MSQIFNSSFNGQADSVKAAKDDESPQRKCDSHNDEMSDGKAELASSAPDESALSLKLHENSKLTADLSTMATASEEAAATSAAISPAHGLTTSKNNNTNSINNTDTSSTLAQAMKPCHWRINLNIRNKRADYDKICSICLSDSPSYTDNGESCYHWFRLSWLTRLWARHKSLASYDDNPLISPCLCTGKRSHQHKRCIENWIEQTGASDCPFCFVRYEYTRRRKSFWSYVKDCEFGVRDLRVSLAAFVFASYLFLVGLSVCHHYVSTINGGYANIDSLLAVGDDDANHVSLGKTTTNGNCGQQERNNHYRDAAKWILGDLEEVLACHLSSYWQSYSKKNRHQQHKTQSGENVAAGAALTTTMMAMNDAHRVGWSSLLVFCFVATMTVLLLLGIISMGLNMAFRHYVRYWLWSRTHFRVEVKPYSFEGAPSEPIGDGLRAVERSTIGINQPEQQQQWQ